MIEINDKKLNQKLFLYKIFFSLNINKKCSVFVLFRISISIQSEFWFVFWCLHREKILGRKEKSKRQKNWFDCSELTETLFYSQLNLQNRPKPKLKFRSFHNLIDSHTQAPAWVKLFGSSSTPSSATRT